MLCEKDLEQKVSVCKCSCIYINCLKMFKHVQTSKLIRIERCFRNILAASVSTNDEIMCEKM